MLLVFLFATLAVGISAAPEEDLITNLPGLSKQPPFKQYSGYLKGDKTGDKFLHYWFVESSSNPRTDPVVLWLNGGPGCSSDLGFLTEHGPFRIQPDGESLTYNPYAWNQVANMIYLESPAGVGFSYSKTKDYATNDTAVANSNALAIKDFFEKFPEYLENEFFITGESYGGIYVPTLTAAILEMPSIKLKGFAVGNGLSDDSDNANSLVYFAYYHGLIGDSDWNYLLTNCCPENGPARCKFDKASMSDRGCNDMLQKVSALAWSSGLDVYNLYAECTGGVNTGLSTVYKEDEGMFVTSYMGWPFSFLEEAKMQRAQLKFLPKDRLRVSPPCTNMTASIKYLNTPEVRKAIHIAPEVGQWLPCSGVVGGLYNRIFTTMTPFYELALSHKLRILVYNGDVDMACNFLGDEWFVDRLALKSKSDRKFWHYKAADGTNQIAGFIKDFEQLQLVTVKGAGHMVPTDKPIPALDMFVNFIQNKPFLV